MSDFSEPIRYCFFFPYIDDSGVPVLFYRMANFLASLNYENNITVIDYENGAMARHLDNLSNIKLQIFHDNEDITPPEDALLIMQSDVPYYWPKELKVKGNTKLLFWNLHPRNIVPSLLPFPFIREIPYNNFFIYKVLSNFYPATLGKLRAYVNLLIDNNALYFMDETNRDYTEKYLLLKPLPVNYLPVPIPESGIQKPPISEKLSKLNCCWVGRLCDFKIHILIYTYTELAKLAVALKVAIKFVIIGNGEYESYAKANIKENKYLSIEFKEAIPHEKLADFLVENVDLVFSMGTSALESAILKVPTILLDFSYSKIKIRYNFRWLFETANFDLGHEINSRDVDVNDNSLCDMIKLLFLNYNQIALKSYDYAIQNHSLIKIAGKLISLGKKTTLTYNMIHKSFFEKPLLLKGYNFMRGINS